MEISEYYGRPLYGHLPGCSRKCLSLRGASLNNSLQDTTIVAAATPRITDHFKRLEDGSRLVHLLAANILTGPLVGWYGSAYLLTICAFQLAFGKCYSIFSIKTVFLSAIAIFELGSLICGVAPNSNTLIIGRAVAGMGCAGIFSGALIIIAYSVPLHKRPAYTGLIGVMYGVASIAGMIRCPTRVSTILGPYHD